MKKVVPLIIIVFIVIAGILSYQIFFVDSDANALKHLFYPPQWENFDFSKREKSTHNSPFSIAPSLSGADVYEAIRVASIEAGIASPVLPHDVDRIPTGSKYFFAVFREALNTQNTYHVRFFALADEHNLDQVYSMWISVVPLDENGQNDGSTEFIFSINDTPQMIRDCMKAFYSKSEN